MYSKFVQLFSVFGRWREDQIMDFGYFTQSE